MKMKLLLMLMQLKKYLLILIQHYGHGQKNHLE